MDEVSILALQGDFRSPAAIDEMMSALAGAQSRVVLSFRRASLTGSVGLTFLLRARKALTARGGEIVLSRPPASFRWFLRRLEIENVFRIFESDQDALEYFGGSGGTGGVTARLIPVRPTGSAAARPPRGGE